MDSASRFPLKTRIAKFSKRLAPSTLSLAANAPSITTPTPFRTSAARQYEENVADGDVHVRQQTHGPHINTEKGVGTMLYQPPSTSTGNAYTHQQAHAQFINIERAGNTFTGVNYGYVAQIEEFHVLRNLPIHPDVSNHLSDYFPDSRSDDEAHILRWIDSTSPPELVLCVLGKVGVGKSTLAKHLATRLRQDGRLAAEIFLGFALPDWTVESVFRIIAGQLCAAYPVLKQAISEAVDLDIGPSVSLETRIRNFVLEPIRSLGLGRPLVVLLDALDQWAPHPLLIEALSCLTTEPHLIRFIGFGRPGLEGLFRDISIGRYSLLDVPEDVMGDYFREKFKQVRWECGRKPNSRTIDRLVNKAGGLFIWSSTLCSLLLDELSCPKPHVTLTAILHSRQNMGDNDILASLYHDAINLRFPKPDHKAKLKVLLGALMVLQQPLPVASFASLLSMEAAVVRKILADLRPLKIVQVQDTNDMVYPASSIFHLSLTEYLQSPDTPSHLRFPIDVFLSHSQLGNACLQELRRIPSSPQPAFTSPLQKYAIRHWPTHTVHGTPTVSPSSDAEWRETPHFAILQCLSISQWRHWASRYLQSLCCSTAMTLSDPPIPDASSIPLTHDAIPQYFISRVLRTLLDTPATAGTSDAIAITEIALRLQHQHPAAWLSLGIAYKNAAESNLSTGLIDSAMRACHRAAELSNDGGRRVHPTLAHCLWLRFSRHGSKEDLSKAISLWREVLLVTPPGHPGHASCLNSLASALDSDYELTGNTNSLEEAIFLHREAMLARPPGDPKRSGSVNNLANALYSYFKLTGAVDILDEAIALHREALSLHPPGHPGRAWSLNNLANSLDSRLKLTGTNGLDEVIVLHREALSLWPPGHPQRPISLHNLANSLRSDFKLKGITDSLDEAIALHREALSIQGPGHPGRASSLDSLALCLYSLFKLTGAAEILDEAIVIHREALLLLAPGHPKRPGFLNNLANSLYSHFKLTGATESLDEAIALHREALSLRPPGHPDRVSSLNNLANSLRSQCELGGKTESLDEAIMLHREALSLRPPDHPDHALSLKNLALSLCCHFELTGTTDSLEEATMLYQVVLSERPLGHPKRWGSLNDLAKTMYYHFELTGIMNILEEVIALYREALSLQPPGHPDRASSLTNLVRSLHSHFKTTRNNDSLCEAIVLHREALSLLPPGHPDRALSLATLANLLESQFELTGRNACLCEAIALYQEVLSLCPPGHRHHALALEYLGESFQDSHRLTSNIRSLGQDFSSLTVDHFTMSS